jgi:hypothetical protein
VARWAGDDLRSVNAQIEYAIRLALKAAGRAPREPGGALDAPDEPSGQRPDELGGGGSKAPGGIDQTPDM